MRGEQPRLWSKNELFSNREKVGRKMKAYFYHHGMREVTSWSCPYCKTFYTGGMDLAVEQSTREHLAECKGARMRLKAEIEGTKKSTVIPMSEMKNGDIGVVKEGPYKGEIVIRGGDVILSLSDPTLFWARELDRNGNKVRLLEPGESVRITVEP
jgi:hypothetical protein